MSAIAGKVAEQRDDVCVELCRHPKLDGGSGGESWVD